MKYSSTIANQIFEVTIDNTERKLRVLLDNKEVPVEFIRRPASNSYVVVMENRTFEFEIVRDEEAYVVHYQGRDYPCRVEDQRLIKLKNAIRQEVTQSEHLEIRSPMPGLVVAAEVAVGEKVRSGQGLIIIEAMKMENEIKSPADGVVREIKVKTSEAVEMNQTLIILE
ncbi:MAG: acetyl-CoA carboxylase biotin carboxyl carrier protein subunit [candidate division KSB1 bacterium]|jgi:biotin carboxyl carrier protein|nr:acetyl-CoA carboxylase biotin carboxyl carrier protein subunit [candidate division KSB1 bacterium]